MRASKGSNPDGGPPLDAERWQRLDDLLGSALERPPEERADFLATSCGDDLSLLREVEDLLAADRQAADFLETPAAVEAGLSTGGATSSPSGPGPIGDKIGPYRLERAIGSGGMGTVYLAVRDDGAYRRRVAVKLLNPGPGSAGLVRRFRGERQILANLDHPYVARLFDGGTTDDGRPYLVMEYVDGEPIDDYCDRHERTVRQRLKLFRKVCSAVHYAHQNLVVHRDIKPSNILVTTEGEPKLLDFGIAKLLDPEAFAVTVEATVAGLHPMTPNYASPEQIRGEAITTATDVYSLGVLLYRLLTGRLPYRLTGMAPRTIERVLSEKEPVKPSTVVLRAESSAIAGPQVAVPRPRELARRLTGDIDNIVLMALAKEPSRRYGSVQQLGDDLRRHLEGLPVVARPSTFGYQMGKFLRRHKLGFAVAALVLFLVVAFALAMAWQAAQVTRQRDLAEAQRARAEQVSRFLVDLFKEVDPIKSRGGTISTPEVLQRGAEKVERELADQPEVRARLLDAIGTVYLNIGLIDEAAVLLEDALATRREILDGDHPEVAESLHHVGGLYLQQGRYEDAEPLLRRALALREGAPTLSPVDLAASLRDLGFLHYSRGEFDAAEPLGRRAVEVLRQSLGPDSAEVALALRTLAGTYVQTGESRQAETLLKEALAIDERVFGEFHAATAANLFNLGVLVSGRGEYAEAEAFVARALAIWERLLEEGNPRIAHSLLVMARMSKFQGRVAEAEERLRRALGVYRLSFEEVHPAIANCLYELGDAVALQDRLAEAEPLLQRSLDIRRELLGTEHPEYGEGLRGLADLRRAQGRLAEAEDLYRQALEVWEQHPESETTVAIPRVYAEFLREQGRADEAEALEERVASAR